MSDKTSIIFKCKDCGGMFFAAVNNEHLKDSADDIAEYIKEGHKLSEVSVDVVSTIDFCVCNVLIGKEVEG